MRQQVGAVAVVDVLHHQSHDVLPWHRITVAKLIPIGDCRGFHRSITPVPNQRIDWKLGGAWQRATGIKSHNLIRAYTHTDGVVREWCRTHQLDARFGVRARGHTGHFGHPSLVTAGGVVVHIELKGHTARRVVNRSGDAHPHKRVARTCPHQIGAGVVAVERQKDVVVVGVGVGLEVKRQKVHLHGVPWLVGAQRDGVILVGVWILEIRSAAVVVGKVDGFRRIAIHCDNASVRDGNHNAFLGLSAVQTEHQSHHHHCEKTSSLLHVHVETIPCKNRPKKRPKNNPNSCTCPRLNPRKCQQLQRSMRRRSVKRRGVPSRSRQRTVHV